MLPGNVDPRRPDKVQRYKPSQSATNGQGEDLTPDYMNILGQQATTATSEHVNNAAGGGGDRRADEEATITAANATNVIPTSPQYGVAIIPNAIVDTESAVIVAADNATPSSETLTTKASSEEMKDPQSTPTRNDRFKVVKIASLEPFKRGRWKCMDYVDEVPAQTVSTTSMTNSGVIAANQAAKIAQSSGNLQVGGVYLQQTQSLPQQQIQQILMQGGYANGAQFFQNMPAQMVPQTQYFYHQSGANNPPTLQQQQLVNSAGVPAQFINSAQQYFQPTNMVPPNSTTFTTIPPQTYQNVQYVHANMLQNQNSAFVPTSGNVQLPINFQQSQTYAGQPQPQPIVNGHAYPPQPNEPIPTPPAKTVILNNVQPQQSQPPPQQQQQQQPTVVSQPQTVQNQQVQFQQQAPSNQFQQQTQNNAQIIQQPAPPIQSNFEQQQTQATNVYTNPQFATSVNSLTVVENNVEPASSETILPETTNAETCTENPDDPAKTNPVVNAIDNKIEQAMDLVKSHLMYTVREEVEVLKEKIAELMERIQQLETENNYLRSQIPKNQVLNVPVATPVQATTPTTSGAASVNQNNTIDVQQIQQ